MKRTSPYFYLVAALVLLAGLLPQSALADTGGTSSGSITIAQVAPYFSYTPPNTSTVVEIYSDNGTTVASTLTPKVQYFAKVTVNDSNTLADLSTVKVLLKFFAAASAPTGNVSADPGNNQTELVLTCSNAGSASPTWSFDGGGGLTTWALVSANCTQPTVTGNSGAYIFAFKPARVATESTGGSVANAGFGVFAYAQNSGGQDAYVWYQDGSSNVKKGINWYGETTVNTTSVAWTGVAPGVDFGGTNSTKTGISVNYVANGGYHTTVGATSSWTGGLGATLDVSGNCTNPREFALKAYYSDTLVSAVLVTPAGTTTQSSLTQTSEAGNDVNTNALYLKLAAVFPVATYSGTITYTIANP